MTRAVKRGLARIKKPLSARHMNVDEVAFKKGHRYITVISDRDGRALALTDDRGTESLAGYLRTLTDGQLPGYQNALNGHECRLYKSSAYPLTLCG